jgi:hypothetical protein
LKQGVKYYGLRSIISLDLFGIWKNCLISGRSPLLYQFTRKLSVLLIEECHCYKLPYKIPTNVLLSIYTNTKLLKIISVGFDVTDQLLIRFLQLPDTTKRMGVQ